MLEKDYFSRQASEYARYRPHYPDTLFRYLSSLTADHACALDCATGNGQAALGLAGFFNRVIATDISEAQIAGAFPHPKIEYKAGSLGQFQLPQHSIDLITVAQALHWFDLEVFYPEVKRLLASDGVLAVWSYALIQIDNQIDSVVRYFHDDVLKSYWPRERWVLIAGYGGLPFPFREFQTPAIEMGAEWTLEDLRGYLRSWSGTQRYLDLRGENPLKIINRPLEAAWGNTSTTKHVRWPLSIRAGTAK